MGDFSGKPRHRMSFEVAERALSKLPSDGLEALLLNGPANVIEWGQKAPLKLVSVALADLGGKAKTADLRKKLDRPHLLKVKWESWWKRVQPELKRSSYFRLLSDGSYQLVAAADLIPGSPLSPLPKRTRGARIGSAQLEEIVARLESGEVGFESLRDAKTLRLVVKEVIRRDATSQGVRTAIGRALIGAVPSARVILEELAVSERPEAFLDTLVQFIDHIEHLPASSVKEKGKGVGEHVATKVHLLEEVVRRFASHRQLDQELPLVSVSVEGILRLGLSIWRKEMSGWRSESLDSLCKAVATLAQKQPKVFDVAAGYLAKDEGAIASRLGLADSLLARVAPEVHSDAVAKLLASALMGSPEFVEESFSRYLRKELRLSWISSTLSRIFSSCDTRAINVLARLLAKTTPELKPEELRTCFQLATAIASVSPETEADLSRIIMEGLRKAVSSADVGSGGRILRAEPQTLLGSIEAAYGAKLNNERAQFEGLRAHLESEVERLSTALQKASAESARMQRLIEQLRSSFRLPERWASFQGKSEVLKIVADLYQEAFLAKDTGHVDGKSIDWILRRVEGMLQRHGVIIRGQAGSSETYDPALHEYIPGSKGEGNQVRIMCPAFEWQDPAGNKIILARAKVVGVGGSNGIYSRH